MRKRYKLNCLLDECSDSTVTLKMTYFNPHQPLYMSPHEIIAKGSEYVVEAHALRELYHLGKTQSMVMPSVSSPAIGYQSRAHLLPSTERVGYGRSGMNVGLQSKLGDDLLGPKNPTISYGSGLGYLVSPREAERASMYRQ